MRSSYGPLYEEPSRLARALVVASAAFVVLLAIWVLAWTLGSRFAPQTAGTPEREIDQRLVGVLAKGRPAAHAAPAEPAALSRPAPPVAVTAAEPAAAVPTPPFAALAPWPGSAQAPEERPGNAAATGDRADMTPDVGPAEGSSGAAGPATIVSPGNEPIPLPPPRPRQTVELDAEASVPLPRARPAATAPEPEGTAPANDISRYWPDMR